MTLHFFNAQLIDPEAGTVTRGTLRVEDGKIAAVLDDTAPIPGDAQVVDCRGKYLAPGIVDLGVKVCEPGERHKESFRSATAPKCLNSSPAVRTRPRLSTSCPWLR